MRTRTRARNDRAYLDTRTNCRGIRQFAMGEILARDMCARHTHDIGSHVYTHTYKHNAHPHADAPCWHAHLPSGPYGRGGRGGAVCRAPRSASAFRRAFRLPRAVRFRGAAFALSSAAGPGGRISKVQNRCG